MRIWGYKNCSVLPPQRGMMTPRYPSARHHAGHPPVIVGRRYTTVAMPDDPPAAEQTNRGRRPLLQQRPGKPFRCPSLQPAALLANDRQPGRGALCRRPEALANVVLGRADHGQAIFVSRHRQTCLAVKRKRFCFIYLFIDSEGD